MAATNIDPGIVRDTELEQRMLEVVVADRNAQPRSQQVQVGPSSVGGCRELLRAGLFESDTLAEPETTWATAAHWGSVDGAELERIFGERMDAVTQQRVTASFGMLGVQISGSTDLIFASDDVIADLKSTDDIGSVLYDLKRNASIIETLLQIKAEGQLYSKNIETPDGGYELTESLVSKIAKLNYYVQIAIYVVGAVQQGILDGDKASGRLVFYDRSGSYQNFVALVVSQAEIDLFYQIGQLRIEQVVQAQMAYEGTGGNPAVKAHLRDMSPSFCFSPKVMCQRRMHCWAGSDWASDNQITNPDHVAATNRYIVGRDLEKLGAGMKRAAKEELREVTGMLPDGKMVTWSASGAINVVETTVREPQTQTRLDEHVPTPDVLAEVTAEQERKAAGVDDAAEASRAMRERELGKLSKAELVALCTAAGLEPKGVKATLVGRILDHEAAHGEIEVGHPDEVEESLKPTPDLELPDDSELEPERDPRLDRVQFVDTDSRPVEEAPEPDPGAYLRPDEVEKQAALDGVAVETQEAGYEQAEVLQFRQRLFGLNQDELEAEAMQRQINPFEARQSLIQRIIDHDHPPAPGRGWAPNGGGTSGDPTTDRLRQMQYDSDPVMRRKYGSEQ